MVKEYLDAINPHFDDPFLQELEAIAKARKIPIAQPESLHLFLQMARLSDARRILEIGTAIGYFAIAVAKHTAADVVSVERDETMVKAANENIAKAGLTERIRVIADDALTLEASSLGAFDAIFIDGAKSQYIKFFERYEGLLRRGGFVFTDNLLFQGFVADVASIRSRHRRQMVAKIRQFNEWVVAHPGFDTFLYDLGDGIAVSIRK